MSDEFNRDLAEDWQLLSKNLITGFKVPPTRENASVRKKRIRYEKQLEQWKKSM